MDLTLSESQRLIRDLAREFAQQEVAPRASELDREEKFASDLMARMGELGFMGVAVPQELGGAGADNLAYALVVEEISRACAATGAIMAAHSSLVCEPILAHGTAAQKEEFLGPLARGEWLGCFALTEPGSGSDAAALTTTARRDGDGWILRGTKRFITNGAEADVCLLLATTDRAKGHKGLCAFLAEKGDFEVARVEEKMGLNASSCAELVFDSRVPGDHLLGEEGQGFRIAMEALDGGRISVGAQAVGIARAALEESVAYSRERRTFGKPIGAHQAIQFVVADMATEIDAARLLTHRAAVLKDQGKSYTRESAMAKLYASDVAVRVTAKNVQIHGGYGYIKEYPAERHFRDAKITEIYEGTSEIQKLVIARSLLR
ncbi:MAG: acyl-CoA dehydrogenase family protein [Nitrospinota bacterium]